MAKIMMCTGKKPKVAAAFKFFVQLEKQKFIKILGKKLKTKRVLIWNYDELKILFETLRSDMKPMPANLTKSLDIYSIKEQAMVVVKFSSRQVEDPLLKPKILALSRPFLGQNVSVKVQEEEIRHNDYKIDRKCKGQITGPVKSVLAYRDLLEKEELCDPKTVSYIF